MERRVAFIVLRVDGGRHAGGQQRADDVEVARRGGGVQRGRARRAVAQGGRRGIGGQHALDDVDVAGGDLGKEGRHVLRRRAGGADHGVRGC